MSYILQSFKRWYKFFKKRKYKLKKSK